MPTMRIVYSRSHTIGGILIRHREAFGDWSHCGVVTELDTVIEARGFHGVVETPLQDFLERYRVGNHRFVDIKVTSPQLGIDWWRSQVGKDYDYLSIFGLAFRNSWQDDARWNCSEGVEMALIKAGRLRFRDCPSHISPNLSYMVI